LTLALAGGEWSASRPGLFTPGESVPGTHWKGDWVDPRAGLDDVKKRKFLTLQGLELRPLGRPARSQSLYRLRYPGTYTTIKLSVNTTLLLSVNCTCTPFIFHAILHLPHFNLFNNLGTNSIIYIL
jgi:hypothetical protein